MTSATLLRKTLRSMLEEHVIPHVRRKGARHLALAQLPLKVPPGFNVREMAHPPLTEADAKRVYPEGKKWDAVAMHAMKFPALYCAVEGEVDLQMGVTTSMLNQAKLNAKPKRQCGGYIVSLTAPAFFLVPPGVPQHTGAHPPWRRDLPHTGSTRYLNIRVLPIGALFSSTTMHDGTHKVGYSLLIKDTQLAPLMGALIDELSTSLPDPQITQSLLLALTLRLKRGMSTQVPTLTDGLYSRFPDSAPADIHEQILHDPTIERAHKYIQMRLHEPLSPATVAAHVHLTPTQLNRIFRSRTGMSTMNYVTRLRMESAQLLLRTSDLSVQEICRLVGYHQLPHFSRVFHRHTGHSPLKFRQQNGSNL